MSTIDLRSDTVTTPTEAMLEAMVHARLGDDVLGEDPTVNELERQAALLLGKQAAVFVSSGTMGNLIGVLVQADRGDEVVVEAESHIVHGELDGLDVIGGIRLRPVATSRGHFSASQVEAQLGAGSGADRPGPAAICFEASHNRHGGTVPTLEELAGARATAIAHGVGTHLDGARLFNAALAMSCSPAQLASCADTVTFCLSKGLCCPAGSVLTGSSEQMMAARRWRKRLGGGMRQSGVLAAAGLVALAGMVERLSEDHRTARMLATGLAELPGCTLDLDRVQTNIVRMSLEGSADRFVEECRSRGVLCSASGPHAVRMVTHHGIPEDHVAAALAAITEIGLTSKPARPDGGTAASGASAVTSARASASAHARS